MKKKLIAIVSVVCLICTLTSAVYAKIDIDEGYIYLEDGYNCEGYLNVQDSSYSAYCETTADRGLDTEFHDYDYISVTLSFDEFNDNYDETYPTDEPAYPNYNEGPNFTTARISATGLNPDYVSGSHAVRRGNLVWLGSTQVSYKSSGN